MMELDLLYVEKKSLVLDLKIIALTPSAILVQLWDIKAGRKRAALAAAVATVPIKASGNSPERNTC